MKILIHTTAKANTTLFDKRTVKIVTYYQEKELLS